MKQYYIDEVKRVSDRINSEKKDFLIAAVTDTHLDNSLPDTLNNIKEVDKNVNFDCMVHMGDFLNEGIPRDYTMKITKAQMEMFRNTHKKFYPAKGNHDDSCYVGEIADKDWYEATDFIDAKRHYPNPYYYVDFEDKKIRIIILSGWFYDGDKKITGIDIKEIEWLKNEALQLDSDWTVVFSSHDTPFEEFTDEGFANDNSRVNGHLLVDTINEAKAEKGFAIAVWLVGHFHGDITAKVSGINFVLTASQTAYVPQLWNMPEGGYFPERTLNAVTEDLWDSVLIDKENKKVKLIRFGAGNDREISY